MAKPCARNSRNYLKPTTLSQKLVAHHENSTLQNVAASWFEALPDCCAALGGDVVGKGAQASLLSVWVLRLSVSQSPHILTPYIVILCRWSQLRREKTVQEEHIHPEVIVERRKGIFLDSSGLWAVCRSVDCWAAIEAKARPIHDDSCPGLTAQCQHTGPLSTWSGPSPHFATSFRVNRCLRFWFPPRDQDRHRLPAPTTNQPQQFFFFNTSSEILWRFPPVPLAFSVFLSQNKII